MRFGIERRPLCDEADDDKGGSGEAPPADALDDVGSTISNADVKAHPLFKKLTDDLAERNKADADRKAADEAAQADAEQKRLKDEGKFEEAIKLEKDGREADARAHALELQVRDLELAITKTGFTNDTFIRGAVAGFDPDKGTIEDYAKHLAENEVNKAFLGEITDPGKPTPPGKPPGGKQGALNARQIKALKNSSDPAERRRGIKILEDYFDAHGQLPPGYSDA